MVEFHSGTYYVTNGNWSQLPFVFGSYEADLAPTLDLKNTTIGPLDLVSGALSPNGAVYANMTVEGRDTIAGGAPAQYVAASGLNINLTPHSTLDNQGFIDTSGPEYGGVVNITGGGSTTLINNGTIEAIRGGVSLMDTHITGNGTIDIAPNMRALNTPSGLELGDSVGSGQTVAFSGAPTPISPFLSPETLLLDKPAQFQASIANFGPDDTIALAGQTITSEGFAQHAASADLLLYNGRHLAADLHFAGSYNAGQFAITDSGGNAYVSFDPTDASHAIIGLPTHHA